MDRSGSGPVHGYILMPALFLFMLMFKSMLNLNTCIWLVSLTVIMKIFVNIILNLELKCAPKWVIM